MTAESSAVSLLREWVSCFSGDDRDRFADLLTDDVEYVQVSSGVVDRTTRAVVASMWGWRRLFISVHGDVLFSFASEDGRHAFLSLIWTCIRKPGSACDAGHVVRFPAWYLGTQRDGRLAAVHDFYDRLAYNEQMGR